MPNAYKFAIVAIACLLGSSGVAEPVAAQPGPPDRCPPRCEIGIEVPSQNTASPRVDIETLFVSAGEDVNWKTNRRIMVIFPEQTPFIDRNSGELVYHFNVRQTHRLRVREHADDLCSPPGCKYIVVDLANPDRPPLDPYIIILP